MVTITNIQKLDDHEYTVSVRRGDTTDSYKLRVTAVVDDDVSFPFIKAESAYYDAFHDAPFTQRLVTELVNDVHQGRSVSLPCDVWDPRDDKLASR